MEVTDDKSLPKAERKRAQVAHAPHLSVKAKAVKLADKTCNLRDVTENPPHDWPLERRQQYFEWGREVIDGLRGEWPELEVVFDHQYPKTATKDFRNCHDPKRKSAVVDPSEPSPIADAFLKALNAGAIEADKKVKSD
jgi:hypothetical protein